MERQTGRAFAWLPTAIAVLMPGRRPARSPGDEAEPPVAGSGRALVIVRQMRCRWCAQTIRSASDRCPICMRPLEREDIGVFDWPLWPDKDARILAGDLAVPLSFDYAAGTERVRRRILAEHMFEWAQAVYVRGHEARRGQTRSFRIDEMADIVDERTGETLEDVQAVRRALLRAEEAVQPAAGSGRNGAAADPATIAAGEAPEATAEGPRAAAAAGHRFVAEQPPPAQDGEPRGRRTEAAGAPLPGGIESEAIPPSPRHRAMQRPDALPGGEGRPGQDARAAALPVTTGSGWLAPAAERRYRVPEPDLPLMEAAKRRSVPFAQGFVVAGSIALGAAGFVAAEHAPDPGAAPATVRETGSPPPGYDSDTRREMEALIRSLREAAAEATAARNAPPPRRRPEEPAASGAPSTPLTSEEVRVLQGALAQLGYPSGPADGIFGARTGAALAAWQSDRLLLQERRPLRMLLSMVQAELAKGPHRTADSGARAAP